MATIIQVKEETTECIEAYLCKAQEHIRMAEHILTEIKEKLDENKD